MAVFMLCIFLVCNLGSRQQNVPASGGHAVPVCVRERSREREYYAAMSRVPSLVMT
jgi:hypothetical protein